jgi:ATP sulfurylase
MAEANLISPHGAEELKILLLEGKERDAELKRAESLPKVVMSTRETGDLIMLGIGGFTPLDGFMGEADWKGVCESMKMTNGLFWPIPITLSHDEKLDAGTEITLVSGETKEIMGTMKVTESYQIDKDFECKHVFTTTAISRKSSLVSISVRPRAARPSRSGVGRRSRRCSCAIRCIAAMSIWPRSRSRSVMVFTSISWLAN